ncbi:unnamed protein product [Urochloa humidicola]
MELRIMLKNITLEAGLQSRGVRGSRGRLDVPGEGVDELFPRKLEDPTDDRVLHVKQKWKHTSKLLHFVLSKFSHVLVFSSFCYVSGMDSWYLQLWYGWSVAKTFICFYNSSEFLY